MIAANEAVARQLTQASVPCLYRVHERPDPERIRTLMAQLASLGVSTPPLPDPLFPAQAAELVGEISRRVDAHVRRTGVGPDSALLACAALAQAGLLFAEERRSRRACTRPATATSPRRSAAIPTSSATVRCSSSIGAGRARGRRAQARRARRMDLRARARRRQASSTRAMTSPHASCSSRSCWRGDTSRCSRARSRA